MIKAILIAVTLACFAGGAAAQSSEMTLNGAQLLSACTKADPEWIGFCNGYMQAAFDATGGKGLEGRHDEATVSGIRIMVLTRGTSRRPRNVLERIEMGGDAGAAPAEKLTHEEKVRRIQHVLLSADPDDPQYLVC